MKPTPISRIAALALTVAFLTACSTYQGPVTNAPQPAGTGGLPGMTRDSAP